MVGLVLSGEIVSVADGEPGSFAGRVYLGDDGRIAAVRHAGAKAPTGFGSAPVVDTGGAIYPGLIDLHNHTAYNTLPLWTEPGHDGPWLNHNSWTGAKTYHPNVVWPAGVLGYAAGPALLAYVELKAVIGGTTSIQGSVSKPKLTAPWLTRIVENEDLGTGKDLVRASTLTTTDATKLHEYVDAMSRGQGFIYHCAEGQPESSVTSEYDALARAGGLRENLIAIHCCALDSSAFGRWSKKPGSVVWSPFSNLWLYGTTTDVVAAHQAGMRICLGSDWGPSGTKHVLGELKVADLHNRKALGGHFTDRELVEMATANPGDALAGPWGEQAGRIAAGNIADLTVVSRRSADPWRNLITATETDVTLVIVGAKAVYGTAELMKATGAAPTGPVVVRGQSRRVSIPRRDQPTQQWPVSEIKAELNQVRANPGGAVSHAKDAADAWVASAVTAPPGATLPPPPLVMVPDMPTAETMLGGLPPEPGKIRIPPLDGLVHDGAFFTRVDANPVHGGALSGLRAYYPNGGG
jgi:cytosine/adenosine deaminase-related metal-dependent hydrolase